MPPISEVVIENLPPFTERVEFKCDATVNLFIGPNGTGKSTLIGHVRNQRHVGPCVTIPAARIEFPKSNDTVGLRTLLGDSTNVGGLNDVLNDSTSAFDARRLYHAIRLMSERLLTQNENTQVIDNYFKALELSYGCTQRICGELLNQEPPTDYFRRNRFRATQQVQLGDGATYQTFRELGETNSIYHRMGLAVNHPIVFDPDGTTRRLFMGDLSNGTQGTLAWVQYMALRIASQYGFNNGWESRPAVLLIDEIENHLHPTWQRRVISAIVDHFPGLQILATTHSPFMVAGLKAGQVHRLYRDEQGIVRVEAPNDEDIVGWTMDEILRGLMGVQDPTDEGTAKAAKELRELRNQGPSDSPEDEEVRQQRIKELHQSVDRDLLAGGRVAAEQELFERQFNEALERYRQSLGSSQEGE